LVDEEVFGSRKHKIDVSLGFEDKSYWPERINFFRLRIATRSAITNHASCSLADIAEDLSLDLQEDHAPNNLGTTVEVCKPLHVTAI
jgi:hypothetical protein